MSDQFTRDQELLNKLYAKAVEIRGAKHEAAKGRTEGLTDQEIAHQIMEKLEPVFGHNKLKISHSKLTDRVHMILSYASVPMDAPELDALNARSNPMISISAPKSEFWFRGKPAPEKITVEQFRGSIARDPKTYKSTLKFRARTDSPVKIVKYVTEFFLKNKAALLTNSKD